MNETTTDFTKEKNEFIRRAEQKLDEWRRMLDRFEAEIKGHDAAYESTYSERAAQFRRDWRALDTQYGALTTASAHEWSTRRARFDEDCRRFEYAVRQTAEEMGRRQEGSLGWAEGFTDHLPPDSAGWAEGMGPRPQGSEGFAEGLGHKARDSRGWAEGYDEAARTDN